MALSKLFLDYAAKLHAATAQSSAAVYLDGVRSAVINTRLQTLLEAGDGELYNAFGSLARGDATAELQTVDLKSALDALGCVGQNIDSDGSHPGVVIYFRRQTQGGSRDANASTTHWSGTIPNGMVIPRRLVANSGANATLDVEVIGRQSGATLPIVYAETSALPTHNAGADAVWTLGPVGLNGTALAGIESVEIDFGIALTIERRDSDIFPSFVSRRLIQPKITIRTSHIDDVTAALGEAGAFYAASQIVIYLAKRVEGGSVEDDATAAHLKFTLGKARGELSGISGDPKTAAFEFTPWNTPGGVVPLVVNTASAIT